MTPLWIFIVLPAVFTCCFLYALPALSRRTQFFAVTVPPEFRQGAEAAAIIRVYRLQVLLHSILGVAGVVWAAIRNAPGWLTVAILWPTAASLVAVALAHRSALRYAVPPSGLRTASLQTRRQQAPGGWLLWAGPFLLLAAASVYIAFHWSQIPERFPIHWGFNNQPNGWAVRSAVGVFRPALIGAAICLYLMLIAWQTVRNSRGSAAMRRATVGCMLGVAYFIAALMAWLTAALPLLHGAPSPAAMVVIFGGVAVLVAATVYFGWRAKVEEDSGAAAPAESALGLSDNTADSNWRGGVFYFNPDDPALFIEKRIGYGYEPNFGNPRAWLFMGSILLVPLVIVLLAQAG